MALIEHITLEEKKYLEALRRVDRAVDKSTGKHKKGFQETDAQVKKSSGIVQKFGKVTKAIGNSIAIAFGTVAVGGVIALQRVLSNGLKENLRFNSEMQKSIAIMGDVSQAQRMQMERTARNVRKSVNIELDKIGEAFFFLASAGLDLEQQLTAIRPVAEFAKAGMFDMATATDLATDAQSALGLTVENSEQNLKNLVRVTDVLVGANTLANATVQQFSESLTNRGAAALKAVNKDVEEGVALLSAWADQGVKGRSAGQGLQILLRDLQRAWDENKASLKEAGIEIFNASGTMNNMGVIIGQIEDRLAGLTDEQKRAELSAMGFREESLIFLQTLLGTSDAIAEYEGKLRDMGGTTKEVAENQMKSLSERFTSLKQIIVDTFGEGAISLIGSFFDTIESKVINLTRFMDKFGDNTDEVLNLLRRAGVEGEAIAKLETRQMLKETQELRKQIEKEFDEMDPVVNVRVRTGERGGMNALLRGDKFEVGELMTVPVDKLPQGMKEVEQLTEKMIGRLSRIDDRIQDAVDRGFEDRAEVLREEARALEQAIIQNQKFMGIKEQLQGLIEAENELMNKNTKTKKENNETTEQATDTGYENEEKLRRNTEQAMEFVSVMGEGFAQVEPNLDLDKLQAGMKGLSGSTQEMLDKLLALQNELSAGNISQESFDRQVKVISEGQLEKLRTLFNMLKDAGLLTDSLQKSFRKAFDEAEKGAKDAEKETGGFLDDLRGIADAIDGIRQLGREFGLIGENLDNAIDSSTSLLRNIQKIKELKGDDNLASVSGVLAGAGAIGAGVAIGSQLLSMLPSRKDNDELRRELRAITTSLKENQRAIEKNTEAFLNSSIVGGENRQSDVDEVAEIIRRIAGERITSIDPTTGEEFTDFTTPDLSQMNMDDLQDELRKLEELFPDLFSGVVDAFETARPAFESGTMNVQDFLRDLGLHDIMDQLRSNFQDFGESLEGAIAEFQMSLQFGTEDLDGALQNFLNKVRGLDGISGELESKLSQIAGLDLTTEEGRKQLEEIVKTLFEGRDEFIGDLSSEEFNRLLEFLQGAGERGSRMDESGEFSRSVQISRTITEIQANEVVALLFSINLKLEGIHSTLKGVGFDNVQQMDLSSMMNSKGFGQTVIDNITVNVDSEVLGSDSIDLIAEEIRKELIAVSTRGF